MTLPAPGLSALPGSLVMQPQFLFFIVVGVLWLIKAIGRAKAAFLGEERPTQGAGQPKPAEQPGPVEMSLTDEERAQLVRQDILEKRAKRQAEAAALMGIPRERQAPVPPPLTRRAPVESIVAPAREAPTAGYAAVQPQAPALAARTSSRAPEVQVPSAGAQWLEELRNRDSARRAILLREILGPPVALR
jgi:hypothetical protein